MPKVVRIIGCGYYAGSNSKYWDMFNVTTREFAKVLTDEDADRLKKALERGGYDVVVEESE